MSATRAVDAPAQRSAATVALTTVLVAAFVVALALLALDAGRELRQLDDRRREALGTRTDPSEQAGSAAAAFRRFRAALGEGARFALVFPPDVDRDQRGFYRLFAGYYLYPATAVADLAAASGVMVFGAPPTSVTSGFEEIDVVDGVWLGRRQP